MKEKKVTLYTCEHCGKNYFKKNFAEKHEFVCAKNPINFRPCFSCRHMDKKEVSIYHDCPMTGEVEEVFSMLYCYKKEHFVYPPSVGIKGNAIETGDEDNLPMPFVCEHAPVVGENDVNLFGDSLW